MTQRRRTNQRGVTILEGMMASIVLLLGLVGVLNGVIFAARQNAIANKMVRAGAIATRVRAGLMTQAPARFNAVAVNSTRCTAANLGAPNSGPGTPLGDFGSSLTFEGDITAACAMNVEEFEEGANSASDKITGALGQNAMENFDVWLIKFTNGAGRTVGATIVVSWFDAFNERKYHTQYVAFYDTTLFKGANL